MSLPAYDGAYLERGCGSRGAFAVAQAWHGPMAAPRSADGASEVTSGKERRRWSPACSRLCMYSAACLAGMVWMWEVAFAARTFIDLGCTGALAAACDGRTCARSS
eukprot:5498026-Pleurochrysis_carterae.AAC.3